MIPPTTRRLDIYGTELGVAWDAPGWGQLRRGRTKLVPPFRGVSHGFTVKFNDPKTKAMHVHFAINLAGHPSEADLLDTLAHEAFHGALDIGHVHQLGNPDEHQEPFAYLTGWLTRWLWESKP